MMRSSEEMDIQTESSQKNLEKEMIHNANKKTAVVVRRQVPSILPHQVIQNFPKHSCGSGKKNRMMHD